ncbi:hypothetical protein HXV84_07180 [Pseudomonas amygdali pv. morsprunorum]|nr:hypothetical protein [Pseudomonas amygdali pv. morsprunorum]
MLKLKVFVRLLNPWSLSLLFTVKNSLYGCGASRVIKHARQLSPAHLRRTVNTPLRVGDFGCLFGPPAENQYMLRPEKVAHYADVEAVCQSVRRFYDRWMSGVQVNSTIS